MLASYSTNGCHDRQSDWQLYIRIAVEYQITSGFALPPPYQCKTSRCLINLYSFGTQREHPVSLGSLWQPLLKFACSAWKGASPEVTNHGSLQA